MASIFITCRQAHALLSGQCDNTLDWRQRLLLRLHLLGCTACTRVARQWVFLSRALRQLGGDDRVVP